jgi:hypothetical protein
MLPYPSTEAFAAFVEGPEDEDGFMTWNKHPNLTQGGERFLMGRSVPYKAWMGHCWADNCTNEDVRESTLWLCPTDYREVVG